jgi:hypothetical protein
MPLVLVLAHRLLYPIGKHMKDYSYFHILVVVSYTVPLLEHREETHSEHLAILNTILEKLPGIEQDIVLQS